MEKTRLGKTELMVTSTAFGALPIQRADMTEAVAILRRAYEGGINFFDTARAYSDSEEKLGKALSDVRSDIIIATKSINTTREKVLEDLATSLRNLKTDHVDILQLHNPKELPDPNDPESSYAGLLEARERGMVRHIGITNHRLETALEAVRSGLYETMQFPLCHLSSDVDLALIDTCVEHDVGAIAMKALSGGLLTNAKAAFGFFRQHPAAVPIWGIQRMHELEEFLALAADPPELDAELEAAIQKDRNELADDFCRACGYCLPCPAEIPIPMAARMGIILRRMPYKRFLADDWYEKMHHIENCIDCGQCRTRCPYGLDTPKLLKRHLKEYDAFCLEHRGEV